MPFAEDKPILSPVKDPGPIPTETAISSSYCRFELAIDSSINECRNSLCLYPSPSDSFVYIILFSFEMDTEQFVVEVSKQRI